MYNWLTTIQSEVIISNWQAVMEWQYSQWLWEEWLQKYIAVQEEYVEAENAVISYREQLIKDLKESQK